MLNKSHCMTKVMRVVAIIQVFITLEQITNHFSNDLDQFECTSNKCSNPYPSYSQHVHAYACIWIRSIGAMRLLKSFHTKMSAIFSCQYGSPFRMYKWYIVFPYRIRLTLRRKVFTFYPKIHFSPSAWASPYRMA